MDSGVYDSIGGINIRWTRTPWRSIWKLALGIAIAISAGCTTSSKMARTQEARAHWPTDAKQAMIAAQQETDRYTKTVETSYEKEKPERDWSSRSIDEIQRTLRSKDAAEMSIVDMQCRATMCRIVVEGDLIQVGEILHRSLPKLSISFAQSLMRSVDVEVDRVKTVIYLVCQGYDLPSAE